MISSSTFSLPKLVVVSTSASCDPKLSPSSPSSLSESDAEPQARKLKGSSQLNRWSRARAVRSGRKLERPSNRNQTTDTSSPIVASGYCTPLSPPPVGSDCDDDVESTLAKSIYMVSDGTGWTAEHAVNAALGQFEHCLVDRNCAVNTHLFSGVSLVFIILYFISSQRLKTKPKLKNGKLKKPAHLSRKRMPC